MALRRCFQQYKSGGNCFQLPTMVFCSCFCSDASRGTRATLKVKHRSRAWGKISGACPAWHLSQPLHFQINSHDKEGFSDVTHRYFTFMQAIISGKKMPAKECSGGISVKARASLVQTNINLRTHPHMRHLLSLWLGWWVWTPRFSLGSRSVRLPRGSERHRTAHRDNPVPAGAHRVLQHRR